MESVRSAKGAERPIWDGLTRSRANGLRGAGAPCEVNLPAGFPSGCPLRTRDVQKGRPKLHIGKESLH